MAEPAPTAPADEQLRRAADILGAGRVAVLTGAGISTDSGIPDYRGEGAPVRTPMTIADFQSGPDARRRYWAGGHAGWRAFRAARPNDAHRLLAAWEEAGRVTGVVTQNVDGLHLRAGSRRVVDLHGTMDRVRCLRCGQIFSRDDVAARIERDNGAPAPLSEARINPDGDAEVFDVERFIVPDCSVCAGLLKPEVVFFGELVPAEKFQEAGDLVRAADALLVAGTSLAVNSGIRLLEIARRRRMPIVVVNRGRTKGDRRADVKIDAGVAETFLALDATMRRARGEKETA